MYGRGPFWGGPYMRRRGFPLLFPMGGFGMGMGMGGGGSFLGDLAAGGIGYVMCMQSAQQSAGQQDQAPQDHPPQTPQYHAPQYQPPQAPHHHPPANHQPPAAPRS